MQGIARREGCGRVSFYDADGKEGGFEKWRGIYHALDSPDWVSIFWGSRHTIIDCVAGT